MLYIAFEMVKRYMWARKNLKDFYTIGFGKVQKEVDLLIAEKKRQSVTLATPMIPKGFA